MKENMNDFVKQVKEFNDVAGNTNGFDERKVALYISLILEESSELLDSLNTTNKDLLSLGKILHNYSESLKAGQYDAEFTKIDKVEALDACVDIAVVALGGGYALGADVEGACNEVMRSNLSKFPIGEDGKRYAIKNSAGKVIKPEGYSSPDLTPFVGV